MQNKIAGRSDFDTKIFDDPVKLLIAIKEYSLNFQESRYKMSIIPDAMKTFFYTRQKDSESLIEYTRRCTSAKDIMESHIGGPIIVKNYIELSKEYKDAMYKYDANITNNITTSTKPNVYDNKYVKNASSKLYAYMYLENVDKSKYYSISRI